MARVGELRKLLQTFIRLKKSCKKAEVSFYSDSNGDCHVTLRAVLQPQHSESGDRGHQGPRRRAGPSHPPTPAPPSAPDRRGRRRDPAPPAPPAPATPAPAAPAAPATAVPAPDRRARRRGPGAIVRDERRRLARIEPDLLQADSPLPIPAGPLVPLLAPALLPVPERKDSPLATPQPSGRDRKDGEAIPQLDGEQSSPPPPSPPTPPPPDDQKADQTASPTLETGTPAPSSCIHCRSVISVTMSPPCDCPTWVCDCCDYWVCGSCCHGPGPGNINHPVYQ